MPPGAERVLRPGAAVGQGRYRLLRAVGVDQRCGAQFWNARDRRLGREVALTVLLGGPPDGQPAGAGDNPIRRILQLAAWSAAHVHPGTARILDVLGAESGLASPDDIAGVVVAAWTPGTGLQDLLDQGALPPYEACRLLGPLAAAVHEAHRAGLVLGLGHPHRIRLTDEGLLRVAFPGARPQATVGDDIAGFGALLYLLLTAYWPVPDASHDLPPAPHDESDAAVTPHGLNPAVPEPLSALVMRCLAGEAAESAPTGSEITQVLAEVATAGKPTDRIHAITTGEQQPDGPDPADPESTPKPARYRTMIGATLLVIATIVAAAWVGHHVVGFFAAEQRVHGAVRPAAPAPTPPVRVQPAAAAVYNVAGDADRADTADRAIDGDPNTGWRTDIYFQNFPAFKPGIGLMVTFPQAVTVAEVTITSPSSGATVELRTSPADNPDLDQTNPIGQAILTDGDTHISLQKRQPTQRILIWITGLSGSDNRWSADIHELTFTAAR
jgi:hypothetical protein